MHKARIAVLLTLTIAVGGVVHAQMVSPFHIIPVVAKVAGAAGTDWMTSMSISNVSDGDVNVNITFYRENQNNAPFVGPSYDLFLSEGQTVNVNDVLGTWFPGQGNTKGFLLLIAQPFDGYHDAKLAVTGRIFNNADPNATYGQAVSSNLIGMLYGHAEAVLTGAQWDSVKRSNVGVVNLGGMPISVLVTVYNQSGGVVSAVVKTVEAFSLRQWSLQQLGVSNLAPGGRVEITPDPDSMMWNPCDPNSWGFGTGYALMMTYISKVDQATGDAEFSHGQNDWTRMTVECDIDPGDGCGDPPTLGLPGQGSEQ